MISQAQSQRSDGNSKNTSRICNSWHSPTRTCQPQLTSCPNNLHNLHFPQQDPNLFFCSDILGATLVCVYVQIAILLLTVYLQEVLFLGDISLYFYFKLTEDSGRWRREGRPPRDFKPVQFCSSCYSWLHTSQTGSGEASHPQTPKSSQNKQPQAKPTL